MDHFIIPDGSRTVRQLSYVQPAWGSKKQKCNLSLGVGRQACCHLLLMCYTTFKSMEVHRAQIKSERLLLYCNSQTNVWCGRHGRKCYTSIRIS